MTTPRSQQVDLEETPYYHCISRCVRRAFLCGEDKVTGKNFDHRKGWLVERMKDLADVFAADIGAYAVMSNHFHLVLRIDRERALGWSDEEVAERWRRLFRRSVEQLETLPKRVRAARIAVWRSRLYDLSWFMRCLNESIARRANEEDDCTGRFWEGRFRSQALLDEGALLTCMSYVDLNPMRAGIADALEASGFTSIQQRLWSAAEERVGCRGAGKAQLDRSIDLLPFEDEVGAAPARETAGGLLGPLPMRRSDYVALLEQTARAIREGRDEDLSGDVATAVSRLDLDPREFIRCVREFSRSFFGMVGHVHRIDAATARRGQRRGLGKRAARRLYQAEAA